MRGDEAPWGLRWRAVSGRCPHMSRQLGAAGPSRGQAQGQRCWAGRLSAPRHKDMHLTYTVHNMHASHTCLLHIDTPPAHSLDTQTRHMRRHRHTTLLTQMHTNAHEHACMRTYLPHISQQHNTPCTCTRAHRHNTHTEQAQAARLALPGLCLPPPHHSLALKQRAPLLALQSLTRCSARCSQLSSPSPANSILPYQAWLCSGLPPHHAASLWMGLRTGTKQGRVGAWRRAGQFSSFLRRHWGSRRANGL